MTAMASEITSLTIVYSTVYSGTDQRKHQSSESQAFVRGIHQWPVNSPHKGPVTRKMFPFDDVIMHYSDVKLPYKHLITVNIIDSIKHAHVFLLLFSCGQIILTPVLWFLYPYSSGLLHGHWGNHMIATVPVKQPWRRWVKPYQKTTKGEPCIHLLGCAVRSPTATESR